MGRPKGSKNKPKNPPDQPQSTTAPVAGQPTVTKGARQKSLPGMENRAIEELNDAALSYDEIKRQRMKLTLTEVEAKKQVSALMHANKKTHYQYGNITIDLVPEGEKVKVTVTPLGTEAPDEDVPSDVEVNVSARPSEEDDLPPDLDADEEPAEEEEDAEIPVG